MKYYKVVKQEYDVNFGIRFYSTSVSKYQTDSDKRIRVEYKVNKWVKAPSETRLFVFDSLNEAQVFAVRCDGVIFECKIKGNINYYPCSSTIEVQNFWNYVNSFLKKKKKIKENNLIHKDLPSVLAKEVMLVKKV